MMKHQWPFFPFIYQINAWNTYIYLHTHTRVYLWANEQLTDHNAGSIWGPMCSSQCQLSGTDLTHQQLFLQTGQEVLWKGKGAVTLHAFCFVSAQVMISSSPARFLPSRKERCHHPQTENRESSSYLKNEVLLPYTFVSAINSKTI